MRALLPGTALLRTQAEHNSQALGPQQGMLAVPSSTLTATVVCT